MDEGAVGHTGGGVLAQELSVMVVPGRVTVDGGPVGHTGVTPQELSVMVVGGSVKVDAGPVGHTGVISQEVSVMVVAGAVGHEEGGAVGQIGVAGQLPVSFSVVVTVDVPAVGAQDPTLVTTLVTGVHEVSGPTAHEVTRLVIVAVAVEQVPTPPTVFDDAEVQSTHDEA